MFTYCGLQSLHTTGNTYFIIIKTQLYLEMRTKLFASSHNHKSTCTGAT